MISVYGLQQHNDFLLDELTSLCQNDGPKLIGFIFSIDDFLPTCVLLAWLSWHRGFDAPRFQ